MEIAGRKISTTFWGNAWCDNLEDYSDYSNRLPRGRTYARNGSILDLQIKQTVTSLVAGSQLYRIAIQIEGMPKKKWESLCRKCSTHIGSLIDLMRGKLSPEVIQHLTDSQGGLFPSPKEIKFSCSCPDSAYMCKHIAATLYGVGHRLDHAPELLFKLRRVDQQELVNTAMKSSSSVVGESSSKEFDDLDLGEVFGIDLDLTSSQSRETTSKPKTKTKPTTKQVSKTDTPRAVTKRGAKKVTQEDVVSTKRGAASNRGTESVTPSKKTTKRVTKVDPANVSTIKIPQATKKGTKSQDESTPKSVTLKTRKKTAK